MILRTATVEDASAIAQLHINSWRAAYAGELPEAFLAHQNLEERTTLWEQRLTSGGMHVTLVEQHENLRAFCAHGWSADDDANSGIWEIKNLHVSPELRGTGIGSVLFDRAVLEARAHGARELTLWVVETNQPARKFYEKKGMEVDGAGQQHEVGINAILREVRYRKRL